MPPWTWTTTTIIIYKSGKCDNAPIGIQTFLLDLLVKQKSNVRDSWYHLGPADFLPCKFLILKCVEHEKEKEVEKSSIVLNRFFFLVAGQARFLIYDLDYVRGPNSK